MSLQNSTTILERNKDVEHIVNAAANLGHYGHGVAEDQRFSMLITTDVHCDGKRLQNAVDYLNGMEALDAGICLGDMQAGNYVENDGTWYRDIVLQSKKPFYTVIGNHDGGNSEEAEISGTKKQVFEKFIAPTIDRIGIPELNKTWYSVNFQEYQVTLIILDNYDVPDDRDETGDYAVSRGVEHIGQEQVDWLIKTLERVPAGNHVLIARHSYPDNAVLKQCNWTIDNHNMEGADHAGVTYHLVEDIVNAWMKGETLEKEYLPDKGVKVLSSVKVNADFRSRGHGIFIGYIVGHTHWDWLGTSRRYPKQNIYCFSATANDMWQNYDSDLPRLEGTKAEDCITVLTVNHKKQCVCLVRIGSNITNTMVDRTFFEISY